MRDQRLQVTAGTLASLRSFLEDGLFVVHYGDVLTDQDFSAMIDFHVEPDVEKVLVIRRVDVGGDQRAGRSVFSS